MVTPAHPKKLTDDVGRSAIGDSALRVVCGFVVWLLADFRYLRLLISGQYRSLSVDLGVTLSDAFLIVHIRQRPATQGGIEATGEQRATVSG